MSILDTVRSWFGSDQGPRPITRGVGPAQPVVEALENVIDPELGIDIVSLGLVRSVEVEDGVAHIGMVLTTPGCPVAGLLVEQIEQEVHAVGLEARVGLLEGVAWSPEDMSPEARQLLGR